MRSTHGAAGRGLEVVGGREVVVRDGWQEEGKEMSASLHPRPAVTSNASDKSCERAPPLSIPRKGCESRRQMQR